MWAVLTVGMLMAVAAAVCVGNRGRRRLAVALATAALPLPFLFPADPPLARFIAAVGACWGLVRVAEIGRHGFPCLSRRLWRTFAAFDTRDVERVSPGWRWDLVLGGGVHALLGAIGLLAAAGAEERTATGMVLRWAGGALAVYGLAGGIADLVRAAYALGGLQVPPIQRHPIAARSLREFWGERWNRVVGTWLRRSIYLPLARRGRPAVALLATFLVSAALHLYMTLAATTWLMGALMFAFFVAQGMLTLLESRVPARARRGWALGGLVVTSPLFVEPMLRVIFPA